MNNFKLKNQPTKISFCKKCVFSNQKVIPSLVVKDDIDHSNKEFLRFDENGICTACLEVEKKFNKKIDWEKREYQLNQILNKYRSRNGSYDCIVPGSGGKDSVFQAEVLKKKYKMNPLTVTFAPARYTDVGMKNFHNWSEYGGVSNFLFNPNGNVYGKLVRLAYENLLHPFQPFIFGQRHFASRMALLFKIPLVFMGEPHTEYGASEEEEDQFEMLRKFYTMKKDDILVSGLSTKELIDKHNISQSDLINFLPLEEKKVIDNGIKILFLGYFEEMKPQENYYKATEISNFTPNEERVEASYSKYSSIDDKTDGFHYWTSYIKFGLGRTSHEAANECRHNYINRDEAISLVKKYDHEFPKKYFNDFLKFTNLTEEQFFEIADKFRPNHLWEKKGNDFKFGNNWKLKNIVS